MLRNKFYQDALNKYPDSFKLHESNHTLMYFYRKRWRYVNPLSDYHAEIEGFNISVDISHKELKHHKFI